MGWEEEEGERRVISLSGEASIDAISALGAGGFVDLAADVQQVFIGAVAPLVQATIWQVDAAPDLFRPAVCQQRGLDNGIVVCDVPRITLFENQHSETREIDCDNVLDGGDLLPGLLQLSCPRQGTAREGGATTGRSSSGIWEGTFLPVVVLSSSFFGGVVP